ncbi:AraC family transcriptional regulator [Hydrogenophaga sp.]|uniref:AraC family transcriptional regulator n=1 Tax=Hydrogenophaga sp. TaxID=1904254 RepID=UPI00263646C3|nr:AraC family transcriptional regulator [Hydrogenophaga sp.]MCW5655975.1 helix-turn-helix domain-containing protein [Hydrogenophaga sp.]
MAAGLRNDLLSVRSYGASHGSHDHDHFQILVGLQGVLELDVGGRGRRIAAGDGCVIAPGERHDFESRLGARCLVLDTQADAWARAAGARPRDGMQSLARYLAQACQAGLPRARTLGPALLLEAWISEPSAPPSRPRRAIDWTVLARHALDAGPGTRVADLAAKAHLSASQLAARCLQEQGLSTQQWLRGLRLEQARMLRAQGLPVAETARRCGYRSPSALTAALRRERPHGP